MLIVKAGLLIDGIGGEPQRDVAIAVEDGRITSIVPAAALAGAEREVVDLGDFTVLPGFIDAHCHLMFEPLHDHDAVRANLAGDDEYAGILRAARNSQLALLAGVTTLRDCGGRGFATIALRDAVRNGLVTGPRVVAAGPAITTTRGHLHFLGMEADSKDELIKAGRQVVKAGADYVKVCVTGGNMTAGSNALLPQYDVTALSALVEDAHRLGRKVAGHVHGTPGIRVAAEAGLDFLEHCSWGGADGESDYDRHALERIIEQGLWVDLTFTAVQRQMLPSGTDDGSGGERLRDNVAVVRRMLADGARCIVSSDAGVRNTRFEDFAQSVEVAVVGCGAAPIDAIAMVTRLPAQALGLDQDLGTVEVGKVADLVAVQGDPLGDIKTLGRVRAVLRSGRVLAWQGRLLPGRNIA